jgi:hypothetical protein
VISGFSVKWSVVLGQYTAYSGNIPESRSNVYQLPEGKEVERFCPEYDSFVP